MKISPSLQRLSVLVFIILIPVLTYGQASKLIINSDGDIAGIQELNPVSYNLIKENIRLPSLKEGQTLENLSEKEKEQFLRNTKLITQANTPKTNFGLIAQDVIKIYPHLVSENADGYLSINYTGFIPLLIKDNNLQRNEMKKLQEELSKLKSQLSNLQQAIADCCLTKPEIRTSNNIHNQTEHVTEQKNILFQNVPNPFSNSTRIKYKLDPSLKNSTILITDLTGKIIREYHRIEESGTIEIKSDDLHPGI